MERTSISGYVAGAEHLIPAFEAISAPDVFAHVLDFLPKHPSRIVEIGAGTGRDAAWLASQGHSLTAVEPVEKFRKAGMLLHPSPLIHWVDDRLPLLTRMLKKGERFDLVLLVAVWQHLTPEERVVAMTNLSKLLSPCGRIIMSVRHGLGLPDRECFPAPTSEAVALACQGNLKILARRSAESVQEKNRAAGVTWTWLVLAHS
ncbi:class I SAM-dependent methyltransferase [Luteimonas kalidii]|uniref:class I SAM-dependent methyltransferase n=1 Tax=Luteimonas kalidii TaxID=3042025 RepID=UPI003CE4C440